MDIKMLQKSNTFSSLSGHVPVSVASAKKNKPLGMGSNLGSWFDRRAKKISMKCSRSITLGEFLLCSPPVQGDSSGFRGPGLG